MANKFVLAAVLAVGLVLSAFAAAETEKEGAPVSVKGVLHEDKNGFFLKVEGVTYGIRINGESKAGMHKLYTGLEGDLVKVSGVLHSEEAADKKPYLVIHSNDITRLKGEKVIVVEEQPVVVREVHKEGATVTLKGILHEDKNGFFLRVNGVIYDIRINDESKAEMRKFYTGLEGDLVKVSGVIHIEEVADKKPYLVIYSNDITRLKGERVTVVEQPVVVREVYVEHPNSFRIPGVLHINW